MTLTAPKWGRSQCSRPMQRSGRDHKLREVPATDQATRAVGCVSAAGHQ